MAKKSKSFSLVVEVKANTDNFKKGIEQAKSGLTQYTNIFKQLPGPIGNASAMLGEMGEKMAKFIAKAGAMAPLGAVIGGGLLAISAPLTAFFTKSKEGMNLLKQKIDGFKGSVLVLTGELIRLGDAMVGDKGQAPIKWGTIFTKVLRGLSTTANLIPAVSRYFDNLEKNTNNSAKAFEYMSKTQKELQKSERAMIVPRALANEKIKEARFLYAEGNGTVEERIGWLQKALDLEAETADKEIEHAEKQAELIKQEKMQKVTYNQWLGEDELRYQEALAHVIDLKSESYGRQLRAVRQVEAAEKALRAEEAERYKEIAEENKKIAELQKTVMLVAGHKAITNRGITSTPSTTFRDTKELPELRTPLTQLEADYKMRLITTEDFLKKRYDAEIAAAKREKKDLLPIEAQYQEDIRQLRQDTQQQYIESVGQVLGAIGDIMQAAKNRELKAAGKNEKEQEAIERRYAKKQQAIAIMQAIINGAQGITKAYAQGGTLGFITSAAIAAAVGGQIALISSQRFAKGGIVSGPTHALVGEYAGARSNPEVIAPLDKLQGMMGGEVEFKIKGDTLVGVLNNHKRKVGSYS